MLKFQKETFVSLLPELPDVFQQHWEDIALDKNAIKLNPHYDEYLKIEQIGKLHCMVARDGEKLAGYFFAIVFPHLHYAHSLTAFSDIYYLKREYRRDFGIVARLRGLIRSTEQMLRDLHVQKVYITSKNYLDLTAVLAKEGYRFIETVHTKLL